MWRWGALKLDVYFFVVKHAQSAGALDVKAQQPHDPFCFFIAAMTQTFNDASSDDFAYVVNVAFHNNTPLHPRRQRLARIAQVLVDKLGHRLRATRVLRLMDEIFVSLFALHAKLA